MTRSLPSKGSSRIELAALVLLVLGIGALRWRLLDVPLERDEGEYAYAAQLLLRGVAPYAGAYTMKLPGTIAAYAGILAVGGESRQAIHAGLLLVNALTASLVFFLARRWFAWEGALTAAAAFGLLSLSRGLLGFTANAEHFVLLPAVGALLWLLHALERDRLWPFAGVGFLLGIALLAKQHGAVFAGFAALWVVVDGRFVRGTHARRIAARVGLLAGGALLPLLLTCAGLAAAGTLGAFRFWTVDYARAYASQVGLADGLSLLGSRVDRNATIFTPLWVLAAAGLASLPWQPRSRSGRCFLGWFALFSLAAVCPGLVFREHYFLLLVPAAALLAGSAIDGLARGSSRFLPPGRARAGARLATALVLVLALVQERAYLFQRAPEAILEEAYGPQGFAESIGVAEYIRAHTSASDRIGVLGSEPQIYFYAGRRAVTSYLYMYPLLEPQPFANRMQLELIEDFETSLPLFVVLTANHRSWLPRRDSQRTVLEWAPAFLDAHYDRVGIADVTPDGKPVYVFGAEAAGREPGANALQVYRRRR